MKLFKINSINGITSEEWEKENSIQSKQYIIIDVSKWDEDAIQVGLNLGLIIIK